MAGFEGFIFVKYYCIVACNKFFPYLRNISFYCRLVSSCDHEPGKNKREEKVRIIDVGMGNGWELLSLGGMNHQRAWLLGKFPMGIGHSFLSIVKTDGR